MHTDLCLCPWAPHVIRCKMLSQLIGAGLGDEVLSQIKLPATMSASHSAADFILKPAKYCLHLLFFPIKIRSGLPFYDMSFLSEWHASTWEPGGSAHKGIAFAAVAYWVRLFHSPNCFVLRPFQFVYIWPLLERDSLLIYCPPLPESGVKSAQGPPSVFRPCSHIVSPGCLLLSQSQDQGETLPDYH